MKIKIPLLTLPIILIFLSLVSAIQLEVSSKPVSNTFISDFNEPAVFDITIKNLGETDNFEIYSTVGVEITPIEPVRILGGETKTIRINALPQGPLQEREGTLPFEYFIKNSKNENQKEQLTINIMSLENVFSINPSPINPSSNEIIIQIRNLANLDFNDLKIEMGSVFFKDYQQAIPIKALETKDISIILDKEKLKTINAGNYLLEARFETKDKSAEKEAIIKFVEQPNIETIDINEGFIIRRNEIYKKNIGNVRETVTITVEKNLVSYLFTTVSPLPAESTVAGFKRIYTWKKELIPNDEIRVVVTTNWLYPIIIILMVIGLFILIKKSIERDISFRKNVSFVRTKGGQFALRVTLRVKAKKLVEKINIIDKLPHLVNLYEKFGAVAPDKIDTHNKRLEWNVESMNSGEERIFSYIIYSHKVGVVGRFELPSAMAVYERNGKIKELTSNRAFFINEPKHGI